ncbi:unnamed protein product [Hymenolepis diminuta]|uniref:HECT-type E3 ubiquitin transferase n=1 Tax=Hymenolepis diminuta TaxID=6216 RepID=A0A3P6ZZV8_HYMDI|nr:unnamed protein product [Hymenolepis diminuta]
MLARPLPAFREFLIQLPVILRSLTLNAPGKDAVLSSGILERYVNTLVSKEYLAVMRSRRTRDPPTYSQGNLNGLGSNQNTPTGALAVQMAQNFQELIRSHREFRIVVFNAILRGFRKIREMGEEPAKLIPTTAETSGSGGDGSRIYMTASTGGASAGLVTGRRRRRIRNHHHGDGSAGDNGGDGGSMDIDVEVMHVGGEDDEEMEEDLEDVLEQTGRVNLSSYVDPDVEDVAEDMLLSGSDGNASDVDHHQGEQQTPPSRTDTPPVSASSSTNLPSTSAPQPQPDPTNQSSTDPSIENQSYILDYILNLSKFMERLHGLGPDWDTSSRNLRVENHQLHSREGIETLFDILSMPGLPYEFPSAYSCAVFAQSILVLLNHMSPADRLWIAIVQSTTACEELKKKSSGGSSDYLSSMLLNTENPNSLEMDFLHSLSTLSSILCVVVYLNVHMKSSARNAFIEIWSEKEYLRDLGHLYQEVSWEAAVILSMIREGTHRRGEVAGGSEMVITHADEAGDQPTPGDLRSVFPRCVEGLSFFKIITPPLSANGESLKLIFPVYLQSSSAAAATTSSRRTTANATPAIASENRPSGVHFSPRPDTTEADTTIPTSNPKLAIIARVALFIAEAFVWRPPPPPQPTPSKTRSSLAISRLQNALQYSAFHLTHVFFDQASSVHTPNNVILRAFALVGGMQYIFESFSEFLELAKQKDNYDEETFSKVLEGMLADIDRLTDLTSLNTDSTNSRYPFDMPKYSKYLFTLLLEPLCLICEGDIMKKLTFRSVESLLNIFKNFAPFVYASNFVEAGPSDDPIAEMGFSRADFECFFDSESTNALLEGIRAVRPSKNLISIIPRHEVMKNVNYLKQHLFEACFTIAKQFNSDETIQMVAEVIVSTNVESSSIEQLVEIVSKEFMALNSQTTSSGSSKDGEVALHLLAFFFARCRFACVRTFSKNGVPDLLYKLLVTVDSGAADHYSPRLYALCALLIDQYERALTSLRLRKRIVNLYASQHSWAWFDESANLWHEHDATEVKSADEAFHDGVFRGTINGRRTQTVEFVPMVQMGDNHVSRPILLLPKLPTSEEQPPSSSQHLQLTAYEEKILYDDEEHGQELYQLSLSQRKALCSAIVNSFERGKLDVSCSDNFLRLLLRFAATSFEDAETLIKSNALKALFDYSPPDNWKTQYKSLLGHLLRQLFYNRKALKAKMSEIVGQIFQGSSTLMQWCCKDLFFSLAAVAPLMARNEELALEVFKEHATLTIPEENLKEGTLPRSYLLEKDPKVDDLPEVPEKLNERQKTIVSFLADRITARPMTEEPQGSTAKPSDKVIFEKELCLNYLMDLATTSRSVAEGLCKMKTFITHLFTDGLRGANSSSTINLLVTIIFSSSSATQAAMITDFKSTLRTIFNSPSYLQATDSEESMCNNQHIIGLMQFLKAALNLPHPIQITVVRHFFKRQIAGDLAKLLAVVNCKVSNGTEALNMITKVLEIFTQIESQILRRGGALDNTEPQVSVVSTVADAMMHTAAETSQPLASALVPTIVEAVDSVHPAPTTTTSSQRQPSTTTQHHVTEEGDTWAEAEDASEMGDTTVEDSTAILILDESGVQTLGGNTESGRGNHDGDNTDGDDDVDNYHDADEGDDEELTSEESHSQGSVDDDHGGEEEEEEEQSNQGDEEDGDRDDDAFTDGNDDDDDDDFHGNQGTAVVADGGPPHVNLINNLMSHVFDVASTDGGTTHIQNRQNDRSFVLQFTTVSGGDDILPGERLIDFVTEGSSRYSFMSHGNSFFVGEANSTTGGDAARSIHNIYRSSNLALPSRTPLIFLPGSGTNLRSVTGGVSDASNTAGNIHLRQLRYNVAAASRRDTSGGASSTYLTLLPNSSRGALARLGALVNTPILVRTNFGASGQTSGYLSLGQPNYMQPLPPFSPLLNDTPRQNRRRQNAQGGSSSSTNTRRRGSTQEMSDLDGDNQAFAMLMDLEDISAHAINEASRNAVNGLSGTAAGTVLPLNAFFSILSAYRHFLATAEILCGQEIMDMLLLARYEVGVFAVGARKEAFEERLEEYLRERSAVQQGETARAEQQETATERQGSTTEGQQQNRIERQVEQEQSELQLGPATEPVAPQRTEDLGSPVVRLVDIGPQLTANADRLLLSDLATSDIDHFVCSCISDEGIEEPVTAAAAERPPNETETAAGTTSEQQEAPGPSTSTGEQPAADITTAEPARIPVTDDEIIASMVASGVDPSFLDALPADLRRELMEDHQRSMRVHSTMMSNVPAEVDHTVLASLPPELQEEVLGAYRETAAAVNASNTAATTEDVFNSMPAHLRREVLADMEDSQLSALTPELQAEARQIRQQNAQDHAHIPANPLHSGQGNQNQVRSFGSLMFPAFFGPSRGNHPADFTVRNGRGIRGGIRTTGFSPASLNMLMSSIPTKPKALLDHEGLSCILGMVIACSGSPDIRRSTYVILKRVIENLCVHAPTRRWIISTIFNIVKGLSDSLTSSSNIMTYSSTSIFGSGFEAPTGSFVQNIQVNPSTNSIGIHPQASQNVCFSLLDVLYDIATTNLSQFVPSTNETPQESGSEMKTDFWEIVAQMTNQTTSDLVPCSSSRKSTSPARIRSSGRHHPSRSHDPSESSVTEEPQTSAALNSYDYYVNIVGLLRHPVVRARPVLQERVISLLVRILDEYHKIRTRQNGAADQEPVHIVTPLVGNIIHDLCELMISKNSSEQTRTLVTWLVVLMTRVDETTKKPFFDLLAVGASSLANTIEQQLTDVIDEVNKLSPNSKRRLHEGDGTTHLQHSDSMTRITPSYAAVVAGPSTSRASNPTPFLPSPSRELELATLQPLFSMRSEQSRLCKILKLMLYLSSCPEVSLQSLETLSTLWKRLSDVLDALQGTSENTIRMFQPLVECMCLAHAKHSQTTISNSSRILPVQLQRRSSTTTWTDISLPRSMNIPMLDSQNIIIFNGFPEESRWESSPGAGSTSPPGDTARPLSPDPNAPQEKPIDMIAWFAEKHRVGLNHILRKHDNNISESALSVFLSYPKSLDFDVKRKFLHSRFNSLRQRSPQLRQDEEHITISRNRIFEDSFSRLHSRNAYDWKKRFVIQFRNEEGQDAGGLLREWYLLMSREIFNPMYGLFSVSPSDRVTYTINPASSVNSNHLTYFEFVGRFIAKAIYDNKHLECYFTRSFYKHILGKQVRFQDLESEDYEFYKGLDFLLNHRIAELNYERNEYGRSQTVDLIENGRNVVVTDENKKEYVRLLCHQKMTESIRPQLDAFLNGFYSIIPKSWINIFNEQELELLISGLPKIDLEDLRSNTTYNKYNLNSPQILWFWKAMESFEEEDRARFIQFVTGTSRVPLGGFRHLEGMHGPTQFTISRASVSSTSHLPSAHTCFNTLELPAYTSYEQLRDRLLTAIRECSEGYGMAYPPSFLLKPNLALSATSSPFSFPLIS